MKMKDKRTDGWLNTFADAVDKANATGLTIDDKGWNSVAVKIHRGLIKDRGLAKRLLRK